MQSIKLKAHVGADGMLKLELPTSLSDIDIEVLVIVQPLNNGQVQPTAKNNGWPPNFFELTEGCLADDPIERAPQGEYEVREVLA